MKTLFYTFIFSLSLMTVISCHTTSETTTNDNRLLTAPMQEQKPDQEEFKDRSEQQAQRTGLAYDEVQKINSYAEQKGKLICQMSQLNKNAEQSLSEYAAQEHKEAIIALDQKLTTLSQEIDTYCNTESRQKYFYQILKQHTIGCE